MRTCELLCWTDFYAGCSLNRFGWNGSSTYFLSSFALFNWSFVVYGVAGLSLFASPLM